MPTNFIKPHFHPPHDDLVEMRKRGLPWLAASSILIILLLIAAVSYLVTRGEQQGPEGLLRFTNIINPTSLPLPHTTTSTTPRPHIPPTRLAPITKVAIPPFVDLGLQEESDDMQVILERERLPNSPTMPKPTLPQPSEMQPPDPFALESDQEEDEEKERQLDYPTEDDEPPLRGDIPDSFEERWRADNRKKKVEDEVGKLTSLLAAPSPVTTTGLPPATITTTTTLTSTPSMLERPTTATPEPSTTMPTVTTTTEVSATTSTSTTSTTAATSSPTSAVPTTSTVTINSSPTTTMAPLITTVLIPTSIPAPTIPPTIVSASSTVRTLSPSSTTQPPTSVTPQISTTTQLASLASLAPPFSPEASSAALLFRPPTPLAPTVAPSFTTVAYHTSPPPSTTVPLATIASSTLASHTAHSPQAPSLHRTDAPARSTTTIPPPRGREESLKKATLPPLPSSSRRFPRAAVHSTNPLCSEIGRNIFLRGGNAVDAAVAVAFCLAGVEQHAASLGGSVIMTIYRPSSGQCDAISGRESAPMYVGKQQLSAKDRETGYTSVGIPGTLHALYTVFKKLRSGKVQWSDVVEPTVDTLMRGFSVSADLAEAINYRSAELHAVGTMKEQYFFDDRPARQGATMIDRVLAVTMKKIAESRDPVTLFYRGDMANSIVYESKSEGAFIAKPDLALYDSKVESGLESRLFPLSSKIICGTMPPSSFPTVQLAVNTVAARYGKNVSDEEFNHFVAEAIRRAAQVTATFGDLDVDTIETAVNSTTPAFLQLLSHSIKDKHLAREIKAKPSDVAAAFANVVDSEGNVVVLQMSLNTPFGSLRRSKSLGIVWNNAMAAFSTESKQANSMEGKKRPITVAAPVIVFDRAAKKLIAAGSATGDYSSLSALSSTLSRILVLGDSVESAVAVPRIDALGGTFETNALPTAQRLIARGHELSPLLRKSSTFVNLVTRVDETNEIQVVCDPRSSIPCGVGF